jgi:hypothetical protein
MNDKRDSGSKKRLPLPPHVRAAIGHKLKEALEPVVSEPVPDRFLRLLDELESRPEGESPSPMPQLAVTRPEGRRDH